MAKYKGTMRIELEFAAEIEANNREDAEREFLELYRITPYADMEYVDGDYTITEIPTDVWTIYAEGSDMTFIMEDRDNTVSVVGFYYGEPNDEYTKQFKGKTTAICEA